MEEVGVVVAVGMVVAAVGFVVLVLRRRGEGKG